VELNPAAGVKERDAPLAIAGNVEVTIFIVLFLFQATIPA
jgi:hypothetical protein